MPEHPGLLHAGRLMERLSEPRGQADLLPTHWCRGTPSVPGLRLLRALPYWGSVGGGNHSILVPRGRHRALILPLLPRGALPFPFPSHPHPWDSSLPLPQLSHRWQLWMLMDVGRTGTRFMVDRTGAANTPLTPSLLPTATQHIPK